VKIRTLLVAVLALSGPAFAASPLSPKSTTFNVSSDVIANCTISATDLSFGNYDPVGTNSTTPLDMSTTVSVLCTKGSSGVTVGINTGTHASGGNRFMADAVSGDTLQYELYSDSSHTTVWGTGAAAVGWATFGPISGGAVAKTVYGRVAAGQDKTVGHYTDVATATVNF
jgi:spore coat protein U-like protein